MRTIITLTLFLFLPINTWAQIHQFDLRDKDGINWMSSVKNQGKCGSCWAHATVGLIEAQYRIALNWPHIDLDLSEQELVSNCYEGGHCAGGNIAGALNHIIGRSDGVCSEECFPYVDFYCVEYSSPCVGCEYVCTNADCDDRCDNGFRWKIDSIVEVQDVKNYLYTIGPVATEVLWGGYFDDDGVYHKGSGGRHCIILVGWNDTPDDNIDDYYIAKNSWGTDWKDGGYFYVDQDDIAADCFGIALMQETLGEIVFEMDDVTRLDSRGNLMLRSLTRIDPIESVENGFEVLKSDGHTILASTDGEGNLRIREALNQGVVSCPEGVVEVRSSDNTVVASIDSSGSLHLKTMLYEAAIGDVEDDRPFIGKRDDLREALDNPGLTYYSGTNAAWTKIDLDATEQNPVAGADADTAYCGSLTNDDKSSRFYSYVSGIGKLSFSWKGRISPGTDTMFVFKIDGMTKYLNVNTGWQRRVFNLGSNRDHTLEWKFYSVDVLNPDDYVYVDFVKWETDLAEALDNEELSLDAYNWIVDTGTYTYGDSSLKNGQVSHDGEAWMFTGFWGPGRIEFDWKVNSQLGDWLEFYVDGILVDRITGFADTWQAFTYPIPGLGRHTVEWRYAKDSGDYDEDVDDAGWIDHVVWIPNGHAGYELPDLSEALIPESELTLASSLNKGWYIDETKSQCGDGSARSGAIGHRETTSMRTTVNGNGTVEFYWKVSSEANDDFLNFYVDGARVAYISGEQEWQLKQHDIHLGGEHILEWVYTRDYNGANGSAGNDCGWVDCLKWTDSPVGEGGAAFGLDTSGVDIVTLGDAGWFNQVSTYHFDGDAAQGGSINNSEESILETTVEGDGTVTFYWRVSSEEDEDELTFFIDDVPQEQISGEQDWAYRNFYIDGPGTHHLEWIYSKDDSVSAGQDTGWVDRLQWFAGETPFDPALTGRIQTTGETPIGGVLLTFSNEGGTATTDENGFYTHNVPYAWSGTMIPSKTSYIFEPSERSFSDVTSPIADLDYIGSDSGSIDLYAQALDVDLSFTTGGESAWTKVDQTYFYDGDSAESGSIDHDQETWLETEIEGEGNLSFYWKASSESLWDKLEFFVDGVLQDGVSGDVDWEQRRYPVFGMGAHTLRWSYSKDSSLSQRDDCAWVDKLEWQPGVPNPMVAGYVRSSGGAGIAQVTLTFSNGGGSTNTSTTGYFSHIVPSGWSGTVRPSRVGYVFEPYSRSYESLTQCASNQDFTGSYSPLSEALDTDRACTTDGDEDWFLTSESAFYDDDCARSGTIGNDQSSNLHMEVEGPGTLTFYWKVSSEQGYDTLGLYINGVYQEDMSGQVDWQQRSYTLAGAGTYLIEWRYSKDNGLSNGEDCAWVDYVSWQPGDSTQFPPIMGYVRTSGGSGMIGATVSFSNGGGSVTTDTEGFFSQTVASGWSGTATAEKNGYAMTPLSRSYENVTTAQFDQDFTGTYAPLSAAMDTNFIISTGGDSDWFKTSYPNMHDGDAVESGDIDDDEESWIQTNIEGAGTVSFYWKVQSENGCDKLRFYLNGVQKDSISGSVGWQQKEYTLSGTGPHTLEWRYTKDYSVSVGDDCGWVDYLVHTP